jgi:predicted nucleotidyltransferase
VVDEAVVSIVQKFLAAVHSSGIPVEFGVLFGSWARGTASPESDIDVMVVSPRFDAPRAHRDVGALWRLAARIDSRIEPLPCGSQQWREDEASPILAVVRQEGEAIAA